MDQPLWGGAQEPLFQQVNPGDSEASMASLRSLGHGGID